MAVSLREKLDPDRKVTVDLADLVVQVARRLSVVRQVWGDRLRLEECRPSVDREDQAARVGPHHGGCLLGWDRVDQVGRQDQVGCRRPGRWDHRVGRAWVASHSSTCLVGRAWLA